MDNDIGIAPHYSYAHAHDIHGKRLLIGNFQANSIPIDCTTICLRTKFGSFFYDDYCAKLLFNSYLKKLYTKVSFIE